MKNITCHRGLLEIQKRLPSSTNGNPRYLVRIDGFTCRTKPDSAHAYDVQNFDGQQVRAEIGTHFGRATVNNLVLLK